MGLLALEGQAFQYQWASDVAFDGIRLEVITDEGKISFDVSVPESGPVTVNTFGNEVPADLIISAIEVARSRE